MIISTRISLVTTPDDETPGAVPPPDDATIPLARGVEPAEPIASPAMVPPEPTVPPAVVPPALVPPAVVPPAVVPPAGAAPPVGPPSQGLPVYAQPAPRGPRKGLLIGLIAGGAVVLIALVVVAALILPKIFGGAATPSATTVADIDSKPDTTWTYDWVGDADRDLITDTPRIVGVGDDLALVWPEFDQYSYESSQSDSEGWYPDYDEHYDLGYEAGLQYAIDYQSYVDDSYPYTVEFPQQEDYGPAGYEQYSDEWLGFDDGFDDAYFDLGRGYSQKEEPVDPDYTQTISLLNTSSGKSPWTIELADIIDGADVSTSFTAQNVAGSAAAVVSAVVDDESYVVAAISTENGELLSTLESDSPVSVISIDGDLIVTTVNDDGEATLGRYAVTGLDDDPKWESDGYDTSFNPTISVLGDELIQVRGDEDGAILLATTGEKASFGDDVDYSVSYDYVGGNLVRSESSEDYTQLEGWNTNGDSTWDVVEAGTAQVVDGTIFTAETSGDAFSELMAVNPGNGEELWQDTFDGEFDAVYAVNGDNVLVASGTSLIVLSLSSGEEKFTQKLGDVSAVWQGATQYYVATNDELVAYSYAEKGDAWTFDLESGQSVTQFGAHLGLVDFDAGELIGLK